MLSSGAFIHCRFTCFSGMFSSLCCELVNWLSERYAIYTLGDVNHPPFVTEHCFSTICFWPYQATGSEDRRKTLMWLAALSVLPHFCCYGWHIPSSDAIPTLSQSPLVPPSPLPSYSIVSSPAISLCFIPPSLISSISLSPLHLLLPPFRQRSNSPCLLVLFYPLVFFCLFFPISPSSLAASPSQLGWPIFQRAVRWRQLDSYLQSAVGTQFLGQWDMLRKKALPSFFFPLSCPTATCLRLTRITLNHSAKWRGKIQSVNLI